MEETENTLKVEDVNTLGSSAVEYAGFWRRFASQILDVLIMLPLTGLVVWGSNQHRLFSLYYFIPGTLIGLWYSVYLVQRYGGTPGKVLMKIRIQKLDGSPVDYQAAFLRFVVLLVLSTLLNIALFIPLLNMTNEEYLALSFTERSQAQVAGAPSWYIFVQWALQIWVWSECFVILTNKKRRAPHDFIAGTVVVKVKPV